MVSTTDTHAWQATATPGLYRRSNGVYYSRYTLNGRRTWRSLDTEVPEVARLRHEKRRGELETSRQSAERINTDLRTLGALSQELRRQIDASAVTQVTKDGYHVWLDRLELNWPADFQTALARSVTRDTVIQLRNHLATRAIVQRGKTETRGYKPAVVNQTLTALRLLLGLAVKTHAIASTPFDQRGVLDGSLLLSPKPRRPQLPSSEVMERLLSAVGTVPDLEKIEDPEMRAIRTAAAANAEEYCRFLAYSGLRRGEAEACQVEDDHGDTLLVRGTKTESAYRVVPVTPALRKVIDAIRLKRKSGSMLAIKSARRALARACRQLGIPSLTHHDLRHYFATVCIESGVPIPTVADWLGHSDGGALLIKTYRHLRDRHSLEAAKTVRF
ncbi:MAG: tyrosine-type recombinase/integrase [Opitutaceae bacterium]